MRVNQCRTRKRLFTPIIEIAEYPVAILRQRRGRSASGSQPRNWWKIVANLQACIPRLQQCVILLKRGGMRDIEALVGEIQMENETVSELFANASMNARKFS